MIDIVEMKLKRVVKLIRGEKGTKVRLQVKPADGGETQVYEMTRRTIELKSQEVRGEIIDAGERIEGATGRIGVINIPSFYRDFDAAQAGVRDFKSTSRDVTAVLRKFAEKGDVDGIVIDLSSNGGGALREAVEVSGLFIDQGPVVQVKTMRGRVRSLDDDDPGVVYRGPLVVLTSRGSASASEIFAAVIKDYGRGLVIGDRTTHGKGTVQQILPVSMEFGRNPQATGGMLKLTIQQFYRVNGDSTQNRGVAADIVLPSLLDSKDVGESFMENAMAFDRVPPAAYHKLAYVSPEILSTLREHSARRVSRQEDFQKVRSNIEKLLELKKRMTISLVESERRAEFERDKDKSKDKGKDKEKKKPNQPLPKPPVFADNFYTDEVLAVTLDYVNLWKMRKTAKR